MAASVEYINTQQWSNLFQVSPSQLNVTYKLQKEEFIKLSIINSCNDCIAWKLKTNRPGRYMVSPRQGIILAKQHKDCTVVLSKLKQVPDTKKPDKFLIQVTKVDPQTQESHLPLLWKDRESKHDKKRHVYAYQSVTIKCFLNIDIKQTQFKPVKPSPLKQELANYTQQLSTTTRRKQLTREQQKLMVVRKELEIMKQNLLNVGNNNESECKECEKHKVKLERIVGNIETELIVWDTSKYSEWSSDVVVDFISTVDNGKYKQYENKLRDIFKKQGVDGNALPHVTKSDLQDWGVDNFMDRTHMFKQITNLRTKKSIASIHNAPQNDEGNFTEYH